MSQEKEILILTEKMLESITKSDWKTYSTMCDSSLTCFEPEASTHLVEGLDFHKFYFDNIPKIENPSTTNSTITSPHVRVTGNVAIISYTRLRQKFDGKTFSTQVSNETRVWEKKNNEWKLVHFHRS